MANIKVTIDYPIANGLPLTFKSPADCSQVTGLAVHYTEGGTTKSKTFQFADAHGNNVGDIDLFASNVLVKVILDVDASKAYVQNADTNAYLEGRFDKKADLVNGKVPSSQLPEMNYAPTSHNHGAGDITSGTLPVARGGTGNTSVDTTPTSGSSKMVTSGGVYTALSGKAASSHNHSAANITSGTLPVARGGTGVTSLDALLTAVGAQPKMITGTYTGNGSSANRTINIGASGFLLLLHREDFNNGWYFIGPRNYAFMFNGSCTATANATRFSDSVLTIAGSESAYFNTSNVVYRYYVLV